MTFKLFPEGFWINQVAVKKHGGKEGTKLGSCLHELSLLKICLPLFIILNIFRMMKSGRHIFKRLSSCKQDPNFVPSLPPCFFTATWLIQKPSGKSLKVISVII